MQSSIKNFLEKSVQERVVPGLVLLFGKPGDVPFCNAFGKRQILPEHKPMATDTVFDVASVTKSVATASLVMLLEQSGLISSCDKVGKFFPTAGEVSEVSIANLLCHRGGLRPWRPYFLRVTKGRKTGGVTDDVFDRKNRQIILKMLLNEELISRPGTKEIYSDIGYMLLGMIIEKVTDTGLDALFEEKIAAPLKLSNTAFRPIDSFVNTGQKLGVAASEKCPWRGNVLIGQVHDDNAFVLNGVAGHAGLFSNAGDLFKFTAEVLRSYKDGSGSLFSQKTIRKYITKPEGGSWAFGWDTPTPGKSTSGSFFSRNSIGCIGFTGCTIWVDLDRDFVVILLANRVHPTRHSNPDFPEFRKSIHDIVMSDVFCPKELA